MVLLIMIPTKWLFHWGYTPFSDIPKLSITLWWTYIAMGNHQKWWVPIAMLVHQRVMFHFQMDFPLPKDDLARGAQLQLRGRLAMRSFERRIVPRSGLEILASRWFLFAGKRWEKMEKNDENRGSTHDFSMKTPIIIEISLGNMGISPWWNCQRWCLHRQWGFDMISFDKQKERLEIRSRRHVLSN